MNCPICTESFSNFSQMKPGTRIQCPHCRSDLLIGSKSIMLYKIGKSLSAPKKIAPSKSDPVATVPTTLVQTPSPNGFWVPVIAGFLTLVATPRVSGPQFLLIFGLVGIILTITNSSLKSKYGTNVVYWPQITIIVIGVVRFLIGLTHHMHNFQLLLVESTVFAIFTSPGESNWGGGSGGGSNGGLDGCSSGWGSSCGSSCSSGCGGGGCGGCGS